MTRASLFHAFGLIILSIAIGCDSGQTGYGSKQSGKATDPPLVALPSSAARIVNEEGIGHFQQGHWDVAMEHYQKAVKADPNSAVVHYNVALTLTRWANMKMPRPHSRKHWSWPRTIRPSRIQRF